MTVLQGVPSTVQIERPNVTSGAVDVGGEGDTEIDDRVRVSS